MKDELLEKAAEAVKNTKIILDDMKKNRVHYNATDLGWRNIDANLIVVETLNLLVQVISKINQSLSTSTLVDLDLKEIDEDDSAGNEEDVLNDEKEKTLDVPEQGPDEADVNIEDEDSGKAIRKDLVEDETLWDDNDVEYEEHHEEHPDIEEPKNEKPEPKKSAPKKKPNVRPSSPKVVSKSKKKGSR